MRNPLVATRYAKALIDLAVETNQLDVVKADIDFLRRVTTPELRAALGSPVIRGEKKSKVFAAIFHGKVSELTESFFDLVFRKGREFVMQDIGEAFDEQYNRIKKIMRVIITTATRIDRQLSEDIYHRISALPRFQDMTIQLEEKVNPKIIGGFVLNAGDYKFDASVRHDLQFIKHEFISNLYKMKVFVR